MKNKIHIIGKDILNLSFDILHSLALILNVNCQNISTCTIIKCKSLKKSK
ncbi:MAG: hypothetical protein ACKESC_01255 [Candidatus Hodgkinia cicadicola]